MSTNFAKQSIEKKILLGLSMVAIASSTLLSFATPATAKEVEAGPIWNNHDAKVKCPAAAAAVNRKWSGQWRTTVYGKASVCGLVAIADVTLFSRGLNQGQSFESNVGVADLSAVGFNDKASSIAINNGQKWRFYKDKNFQGEFIEVGPEDTLSHLGNLNNQISSFKSVQ
jgi:Beta/Gamma crystallin/Mannan-binding protein